MNTSQPSSAVARATARYVALVFISGGSLLAGGALLGLDIIYGDTARWLIPVDRTVWTLAALALIAAGWARYAYLQARVPPRRDTLVEVRELRAQLDELLGQDRAPARGLRPVEPAGPVERTRRIPRAGA